jgi:hypothetical protein
MRVEEFHLTLPSKDLKTSLEFYTEGCCSPLDRFQLTFAPADGRCMPVHRRGDGRLFAVQVDDIRGSYERVRARGRARFEQHIELMMPGIWRFRIIDNHGYFVGFSQPNRDR